MCFVETGGGKAGIGRGNFYAEPVPTVALHPPGRVGHLVKVLFEQQWLRGWA
jgi:sulfide:quinone oxidoreductase